MLSLKPGGCSEKGGDGGLSGREGGLHQGGGSEFSSLPVSWGPGMGELPQEEMHLGGSESPKSSNQSPKASFPAPASLSPPLPLLALPQTFLRSFYLNLLPSLSPPPKFFGNLSTFFQVFPGQFGVRFRARSGRFNTHSWVEWTRQ